MTMQDHLLLGEALRSYFVEHLPAELLPVPGGHFSLDGLLDDGDSMSLQIVGGEVRKSYINGSRLMDMQFSIFYRSDSAINDNDAKSAMMGVLNGIGAWMAGVMEDEAPYLGDWLTVNRFEQIMLANIADSGNQNNQGINYITYQAGYALGYKTKR